MMPDNDEDEDNEDSEELSFWDECSREARKNPVPRRGGPLLGQSGGKAGGTAEPKKRVSREEVCLFM